jgi:ribosomal protein S18 acetylase RimI-like enzyme
MSITYKRDAAIDASEMADLFQRSGLKRPEEPERLERMLRHANLIITAWDGERLVGIARALTDFSFCCYLSDLAVDKAYQKQRIGQTLMEHVSKAIGDESMLLLLSVADAMAYYPKVGFQKVENGRIIKRKK